MSQMRRLFADNTSYYQVEANKHQQTASKDLLEKLNERLDSQVGG